MANKFAVIDFETTGLSPRQGDRIIEVAVVILESGKVVNQYQSLVRTVNYVPSFIEGLTGINSNMIANAPSPVSVLPVVVNLIEGCTLIAHNASFDSKFLFSELSYLGINKNFDFICTLLLSRRLYQYTTNLKLATLAKYHSIQFEGSSHRALYDAMVTANLFLNIQEDLKRHLAVTEINPKMFIRAQKEPLKNFHQTAFNIHTEKKQNYGGKNQRFAGISSMVSPVNLTEQNREKKPQNKADSSTHTQTSSTKLQSLGNSKLIPQTNQALVEPNEFIISGKWSTNLVAVVIAITSVLFMLSRCDNNTSTTSYTQSQLNSAVTSPFPKRQIEVKPPVGKHILLNESQIRYCLSEEIRLEAASSIVKTKSKSRLKKLNGMVTDYKSRCEYYSYMGNSLNSARRDIAPFISDLRSDGLKLIK